MRKENRILILGGLGLIALTMFFGFWYAVFDEHQTLVGMGVALATGFAEAAQGNLDAAYVAIDQYAVTAREYGHEIHFHGHFGFLGVTLILYGLVAHTLGFGDSARVRLATLLAASAFLFPFGVFLQIVAMDQLGKALAVVGSIGLVLGMFGVVIGVLRQQKVAG
jgi:hypothetical protein